MGASIGEGSVRSPAARGGLPHRIEDVSQRFVGLAESAAAVTLRLGPASDMLYLVVDGVQSSRFFVTLILRGVAEVLPMYRTRTMFGQSRFELSCESYLLTGW